jgi:predicted Rossmann-fold nucleotide-binding protein
MSKVALRHLDAPCILYDLNGYYTGMRILLDRMVSSGLSTPEKLKDITFAETLDDVVRALERR